MIGTLFGRKKITEEKMANVFVNAVLNLTLEGFPTVMEELNESPEFVASPRIGTDDHDAFGMILLAGNLMEAPRHLDSGLDRRLFSLAVSKYSEAIGARCADMETAVLGLQQFMSQINHPSKNTVYAMSKAVFHKYDLFRFQEPYFRDQKAPNPIVLKRLNGLMNYFLWNWEEFMEEFRVTH